jgi:UDP-galactopyranose mutase
MTRFAKERRVFFVEEPLWGAALSRLRHATSKGVQVLTPELRRGDAVYETQRDLLDAFFHAQNIESFVLWYYTAMAVPFTRHLAASAIVYDCMDELSAFRGAPPELQLRERELFERADVVFTGGQSLYEAKRGVHHNVHAFPSSVDVAHFAAARTVGDEPDDQRHIPRPRAGFYGVLDERLDIDLVRNVAERLPTHQFVFIGPTVKIDPTTLPRARNIHYLGPKTYEALPRYLAGWDAALLPFAKNEATRFISPTKTPEYLAAARPVISTSIHDVVRPYGELGLAYLADPPDAFAAAIKKAIATHSPAQVAAADAFLSTMSWDRTWSAMRERLLAEIRANEPNVIALTPRSAVHRRASEAT